MSAPEPKLAGTCSKHGYRETCQAAVPVQHFVQAQSFLFGILTAVA